MNRLARLYIQFFNGLAQGVRRLWFRGCDQNAVRRILVQRTGKIGDVVCALPAWHAIREHFPQASIALLMSQTGPRDLVEADRVMVRPEQAGWRFKARWLLALRREKFDLFIDLPGNFVGITAGFQRLCLARWIGCRDAWGVRIETPDGFGNARFHGPHCSNEVTRLLDILREDGRVQTAAVRFDVPVQEADARRVSTLFRLAGDGPVVALNPGASRQVNHWPASRFIEVGRFLISQYQAQVVILGSPAETRLAEWVQKGIGPRSVVAAGLCSLLQTAALLKRCALLISNDTGTMHLSAAVGTPVLAIFSARDLPGRWHPYGEQHRIFSKPVACGGCFRTSCRARTCIKAVDAEEVMAEINRLFMDRSGDDGGREHLALCMEIPL